MTWEPYGGGTVVGDVRVLRGDRDHHETAWARRLPDALRFLLA